MSLHDRVMRLRTEPYIETLSDEARVAYKNGHKVARHYAAELSLEADELIAEMARALEYYESAVDDESPASMTLIKYNAWKESTK